VTRERGERPVAWGSRGYPATAPRGSSLRRRGSTPTSDSWA
jgi:hypothetical protein